MKQGGESAWKVSDILNGLFRIDPDIEAEAAAMLSAFNPKLIINMAYKPKDLTSGEKLRKISKNYLNIDMEYLGFLYRDKAVEDSIAQRHPLAVIDPSNSTYQTVIRMAYKIVSARKLPYFVLDIDNYEDSFEAIMDEATDDLSARIEGYNELANEELLSVNELLSSIKNLEYENIELKKKIKELERKLLLKH
jgi:flagellar biosynthesis protein FlhG